jgi:phosphopantothenoylcysteine synthetase/decarboxylase
MHGYQAIRSTYHTTLQATICQLVFGRDMIQNIAFRENWDQIQKNRTLEISPIKKKIRTIVIFLMNIRLETK